jgi:glycosyltransferase involved in cell wall biosynthesis
VRVCLLSNVYPPDVIGGAEVVVGRLAQGFRAVGHEVTAVATAPPARAGWETVDGIRVCRLAPANLYWAGDAPRRGPLLKPLWHLVDLWNPTMYQRLRAVFAATKPDLVHTHNLGGLSAAAWSAAHAAGLPLVHTLHDHSLTCVRAVRMTRSGRVCARQCVSCAVRSGWLERQSRVVDAVTGPARFVLERHRDLGFFPMAETAVVPWGAPPVAPITPPRADDGGPLRCLFIGSLQPHKGVGVALEAFRRAPDARASLDIAGAGALADVCRAAAARDPRIRFHGFVTGEEKERLLAAADVLLFPSLCWEVVGLVMLEAFAHGVPVIASRTGGVPEFVEEGQTGVLVEPGDGAAFATHIRRWAVDRRSLEPLREACRASAARFTWARTVGEMVEVYKAALGRRNHAVLLRGAFTQNRRG